MARKNLSIQSFLLWFSFSLVIAVSMQIANVSISHATNNSIPLSIFKCISELKQYPDRYILASSQNQGTSYYIVAVNQPDTRDEAGFDGAPSISPEKQYWESVVSVQNDQCKLLVGRNQAFTTLTRFMPKLQAQDLELQRIKRYVQVYGRNKLQRGLNQLSEQQAALSKRPSISASINPISPETKWAYEQLGFKVPKNIPIAAQQNK